ncbi:hypothetical protein HK101_011705 [Irineochytrium annulatum]|nr:hypothetical protein HK101_011705 [Irineochytrium annulatum]
MAEKGLRELGQTAFEKERAEKIKNAQVNWLALAEMEWARKIMKMQAFHLCSSLRAKPALS